MAFQTSDQIGRFAELIAETDLSRPVRGRYRRPLFRAVRLGEKYPIVDFLVDILGPDDLALGFFFAQVKGTTLLPTGARLAVDVDAERYNRLVRIPAPTYLLGVDVSAEETYLIAAHRPRAAGVSSITRAFRLRD